MIKRVMTPTGIRRTAAGIGLAVAMLCMLFLVLEGTPEDPSVSATLATKSVHATRTGCTQTCEKPQTTEGEVSVKSNTTGTPGSGGALDRALDNDVGVTVIRLLLAIALGAASGLATARFLTAWLPGGGAGIAAKSQGPPKQPDEGREQRPKVSRASLSDEPEEAGGSVEVSGA
jgi:hypothetical protein